MVKYQFLLDYSQLRIRFHHDQCSGVKYVQFVFHETFSGDSLLIVVQVVATILAGTTQLGVQAWYRDYYLVRVDCSPFLLRMFAHIP